MKKRHFPWSLLTGLKFRPSSLLGPSLPLTRISLRLCMGHPQVSVLDWPWFGVVPLKNLQKVLFRVLLMVLVCACLTPCLHK
jgi:hypothetical protein